LFSNIFETENVTVSSKDPDPHHVGADPDQIFHFDADPDPAF
jgi:hypothetical protein